MSGISSNYSYTPNMNFKANNQQQIKNVVELPPSNETYRKNGKKVRANMGWGWGSVITGGVLAQCVGPVVSNIFGKKAEIVGFKADLETAKNTLKTLTDAGKGLVEGSAEHMGHMLKIKNENLRVESLTKVLERSNGELKGLYKSVPKWAAVGLALGVGFVMLINHYRNNKRAKLAAEPEKVYA